MYLHKLKIWNFRRFGIDAPNGESFAESKPGFEIEFHKGLNVLIGENDCGKTTVIDAIKYVLRTHTGEYISPDEKDFHLTQDGIRATEFKIECEFRGLTQEEKGIFLDWIDFTINPEDKVCLVTRLYAKSTEDNGIIKRFSTGRIGESSPMSGLAREMLQVVYLKPLRDALIDMTHGFKSRFAHILKAHKVFRRTKNEQGEFINHKLEDLFKDFRENVEKFFQNEEGCDIYQQINNVLSESLLIKGDNRSATINMTGYDLIDILRLLDLILEDNKSGLGSLNLLCMAAELLLFIEEKEGLKLTLIEELEAHLHPQYQENVIHYINQNEALGQFILSTHSNIVGSSIPIENLILIKEGNGYSLSTDNTKLFPTDYQFLHRFLDATKANLFFAKGIIAVEGDAENLLLPIIAEIIDRPLHRYGVSILNVGSTAFKRYVKIFQRAGGSWINIPIAIVTDLDVPPLEYYLSENKTIPKGRLITPEIISNFKNITEDVYWENCPEFIKSFNAFKDFITDNKKVTRFAAGQNIQNKLEKLFNDIPETLIDNDIINKIRTFQSNKLNSIFGIDNSICKVFNPKQWTLEYEIASSKLSKYLVQAIWIAKKIQNNDKIEITDEHYKQAKQHSENDGAYDYDNLTDADKFNIYEPLLKRVSKAITAQYLGELLLQNREEVIGILQNDEFLKYLTNAIYHVTEPPHEDGQDVV